MIYLPNHVAENLVREQQEDEVDKHLSLAMQTNSALHAKDHRLELVFIKEKATSPDVVPGRWHVKRHNDGDAPNSYIPITGEKGEYIEPSPDRIIARLNEMDMWRRGSVEAQFAAKKAVKEAEEKQLAAEMDEVADDARITAKVIMGQGSAPKHKTGAATARARAV